MKYTVFGTGRNAVTVLGDTVFQHPTHTISFRLDKKGLRRFLFGKNKLMIYLMKIRIRFYRIAARCGTVASDTS
jgi:hypothetical protein